MDTFTLILLIFAKLGHWLKMDTVSLIKN